MTPDIADAVAAGLTRQAEQDDAEHAVYGFDAKDELGLHPIIQEALRIMSSAASNRIFASAKGNATPWFLPIWRPNTTRSLA